ncbi:Cu(I)-responsive transcriptional regulator [Luteolibacter sp. SL250]|uniref:Cu(I)-responsive transcriptional regulator n=1 Tax=Luteolibacter sp. SL250 TaxID=2995170 RepID=UPI002270C08C|nr:Cu(I)-responsive transcriptional regulator [Luteolibacter sp. SL250]WAC20869.1 Cu(I)-responsive transcriptional regulator [Luteolibacter sp. SL250]
MNIGQTAKASGISAKMIRYYESVGLITPADRSGAGYRIYSARDVQVLNFIRRSRDLGFKVEDIRDLLQLWRDRSRKSASVKKMVLGHIRTLEQKVVELQEMLDTLRTLADSCSGDQTPACPIIDTLEAGVSTAGNGPEEIPQGQARHRKGREFREGRSGV